MVELERCEDFTVFFPPQVEEIYKMVGKKQCVIVTLNMSHSVQMTNACALVQAS